MSDEDLTADGFWRRVEAKRAVAQAMVNQRAHCVEAYIAAGFAVECALKALIIQQRRWNSWSDLSRQEGLHIHDLRRLMREAGIELSAIPPAMKPKVRMVLDWTRGHDYHSKRMPRSTAGSMVEAVFGEQGVLEWLKTIS